MSVFAELSEDLGTIEVFFPYDPQNVARVKTVPGARFVAKDKGGPYWRLQRDMTTARRLRAAFNADLQLGRALKEWAKFEVRQERVLSQLADADTAPLLNLPTAAPVLHDLLTDRPYQLADVRFMAQADNPLNANGPGLGKTPETIASVWEAGLMDAGPHLVIARKKALNVVWGDMLRQWQPYPVLVTAAGGKDAQAVYAEAERLASLQKPFWLVTNSYAIQATDDGHKVPALGRIHWATFTIDEFHKEGLANKKAITRKGADTIKCQKKNVLSGTPIGGKERRYWAVLNFLEPEAFSSEWRWIYNWLDVKEEEVYVKGGHGMKRKVKVVGHMREGLQEEFRKAHARYMVRRLRPEVQDQIKGSQPKPTPIDIWCEMEPRQRAAYDKFESDAYVLTDGGMIVSGGNLASRIRLRQFASATCTVRNGEVHPTSDSCKLEALLDKLAEHGITGDADEAGSEQSLVFTFSSRMANMVAHELRERGINAQAYTGETKEQVADQLIHDFNLRNGAQVLVMTTTTGGVSLTINECESIHFLDETENVDDQTQAEDRNRLGSAAIYYYRTKNTIEEDVYGNNLEKKDINDIVLDRYRKRRGK